MNNNKSGESSIKVLPVGFLKAESQDFMWISGSINALGTGILIYGCIITDAENITVRIFQGSAVVLEVSAAPGFIAEVPLYRGIFHVEVYKGDLKIGMWEVADQEQEDFAFSGMVPPRQVGPEVTGTVEPYAFYGRMGQLFLGGDSNDSIGQYAESKSMPEDSVNGWTATFDKFDEWKNRFQLKNISVLIAPAKEEILREYFPLPRARRTVVDDFVARFGKRNLIFPKWELWNRRHLTYSATDTHWTDFGATIAAAAVLANWSIPAAGIPEAYRVVQRIGDLGVKAEPKLSSYELRFLDKNLGNLSFDNGINNQGAIKIYSNPNAPIGESLLIFGDSFGTNLAQAFSCVFEKVTYTYQPAGFDPELVDIIKPDHILLQITQRFLHGQPATGQRVFNMVHKKLSQMSPEARSELLSRLLNLPDDFRYIVEPMLREVS